MVKRQPQSGAPRWQKQTATMESLPRAFEVVKEMPAGGLGWGEGYRPPMNLDVTDASHSPASMAVDGPESLRKVMYRLRPGQGA